MPNAPSDRGLTMGASTVHNNNFNLIRLLAALQVLTVHALFHFGYDGPLVSALEIVPGVPVFFFMSGYLICTSYRRMRERGLVPFFTNRFLRIYPALWVCVAVSTLAVALTGFYASQVVAPHRFVLWLLGQATFFQFYNPDFMRPFGVGVLNGALWTITVELQFYMLAPLLFHLLERRRALLLILFGLSMATNLYLGHTDRSALSMKLLQVSFVPWVYMFMVGFVAAFFDRVADSVKRIPFWILVPPFLLSMFVVGTYEANASNRINPLSFAILSAVLLRLSTTRLPVLRSAQRFVANSDFSYGVYLYHMPVINMLIFLGWTSSGIGGGLAFTATMVAAALSWYLVERPSLRYKR